MNMDTRPEPDRGHSPSPDSATAPGRSPWRPFVWGALCMAGASAVVFAVAFRGSHTPAPATGSAAPGLVPLDDNAVAMPAGAPQWKYVETAVASKGAPLMPVPAPAHVAVDEARESPVFAPLAGRVEEVAVQLGQEVKAGTKLVAIRSSTLPELAREIESAKATLAVKTTGVERVRDLVQLKAVPEKDLLLAEQERHEAELALHASEGKKNSLHIGAMDANGLYWVSAPRAGTVVERRALVGMEVGPDRSEPLVSVADLSEVIVVADVLESDIASVKPGESAVVTGAALGDERLTGTVNYVAQLVDPVRRTVAVRLRVANQNRRLRPNAFAQVSFPAAGGDRVVVPAEAVVTDGQRTVVFVKRPGQSGQDRLERRSVRVGRTRDGRTEILEGLAQGETYVARGALLLLNALTLGR